MADTSALEFSASADTVVLGETFSCLPDSAFTLEYWLCSTNPAVENGTFYSVLHSTSSADQSLRHDPYDWIMCKESYVTQNSGIRLAAPVATAYIEKNLENGAWVHFAITRDETNAASFYIDGVLISSSIWDGQLELDRIGQRLMGRVADIRFWNCTRSAEEIELNMKRRLSGTEEGLVAYWPLNDGVGNSATNLVDDANNGAISGAQWVQDAHLVLVDSDSRYIPAAPLVLANPGTGSRRFTNTDSVEVVDFPIPPNTDLFQITRSGDPETIDPEAWTSVFETPEQLYFDAPEADEDVKFYVWFTNDVDSVALRLSEGVMRYTTAMPLPIVHSTLARESAGFTVRLLPAEIDYATGGGSTGGEDIPLQTIELLDMSDPGVDLTPLSSYRTLPAVAGEYSFALRVVNAAGNAATSDVCTVTMSTTNALPAGQRYVAIGNLNAESPFSTWTTAAAEIQAAVNVAADNDKILVARGTYHGTANPIVNITRPLQLIGAHPREEVILDGGDGAFGNRKGIIATLPEPGDDEPLLRFENLTVTRCFRQEQYGDTGVGMIIEHGNVTKGTATIHNCVFSENRGLLGRASNGQGAGLYATGTSGSEFHISISDCLFRNNLAFCNTSHGAGSYLADGRFTVNNSVYINNKAGGVRRQEAATTASSGGGAFLIRAAPGSVVRGCLFENNSAPQGGGGSYAGGLYISTLPVLVENSLFRHNFSDYVGAIKFTTATHTNVLRNCIVVRNSSRAWGGGIECAANTFLEIENCTIYGNIAGSNYGGIVAQYAGGRVNSRNSIIYGNTPNNSDNYGSPKYFEYCCTSPITTVNQRYYLEGNISSDPQFVNEPADNFELKADSPCRNAGTNLAWMVGAKDFAGRPRRDAGAGRVDIGAYEYQSPGALLLVK